MSPPMRSGSVGSPLAAMAAAVPPLFMSTAAADEVPRAGQAARLKSFAE